VNKKYINIIKKRAKTEQKTLSNNPDFVFEIFKN